MPLYQFQGPDGEVIERVFPITSPQASGAPIVEGGRTYKRIISIPAGVQVERPIHNHTLPLGYGEVDPRTGAQVFSRRTARDAIKQARDRGERFQYDLV